MGRTAFQGVALDHRRHVAEDHNVRVAAGNGLVENGNLAAVENMVDNGDVETFARRAGAGALGLDDRVVGAAVAFDDHLQLPARIIERQQIADLLRDETAFVVGRHDDGNARPIAIRRIGASGNRCPQPSRQNAKQRRVEGMVVDDKTGADQE
jgi:hypothetical protein